MGTDEVLGGGASLVTSGPCALKRLFFVTDREGSSTIATLKLPYGGIHLIYSKSSLFSVFTIQQEVVARLGK